MIDIMVKKLVAQAHQVAGMGQRAAEQVKYQAIFITPNGSFKTLGVEAYAEFGDFVGGRSTDFTVKIRMRPSMYINNLLPYKDNLTVQFITTDMTNNLVREFVANPLADVDVRSEGNNSMHANVEGLSEAAIQAYEFQLLDPVYAKARTIETSYIGLMGQVGTVLSVLYEREMRRAGFTTVDYQGLVMDTPVDNTINYSAITVPEGIRLTKLATFLQDSEKYGVYSKGLGLFFKQKRWWIYRLYDLYKYDDHPSPIDIIRLPEDKAPTLEFTFFITATGLTILSTGKTSQEDGSDIERQNNGVGMRLVNPDLVGGDAGVRINAGRAIKTRVDSLAEYQTAERGNGNDYVPLNPVPTSNVNKYASLNAIADGTIINVPWHCGDPGYLEPGAPVRYQFMGASDRMETRRGVLLGYRMDTKVIDPMTLLMKRSITLIIFMSKPTV